MKKANPVIIFFIISMLLTTITNGQNNRQNQYNNIGWYNYFGTLKFSDKIGLHHEYQWRRNNLINNHQQSLLRLGINYKPKTNLLCRIGYAWVETYAYGDIPINVYGKDFTEHRIFEMFQMVHKEGMVEFSHRYMLEQRFVGKYSSSDISKEDEFIFSNRLRYLFRTQVPLKGNDMKEKTPYVAVYNEIFLGFGKKVNANVFDQNRIGVLLGYKMNKNVMVESGYLNQLIQFGRTVNGKNIFEHNSGIILNLYINIDLQKNEVK